MLAVPSRGRPPIRSRRLLLFITIAVLQAVTREGAGVRGHGQAL